MGMAELSSGASGMYRNDIANNGVCRQMACAIDKKHRGGDNGNNRKAAPVLYNMGVRRRRRLGGASSAVARR